MREVVIENPVINSPFEEPARHFRFGDEGITDEIVEARRVSSYFIPIARPKKKGKQLVFDTEWTEDRIEENKFINRRPRAGRPLARGRLLGRHQDHPPPARLLAAHGRERRLFFCQIEALETAIYLTEVAPQVRRRLDREQLREPNEDANPGLYRIAFKMATGSGKTVVMAMLIAWQALNKLANPQDARFSDAFLVVTPGITIRDRLRVLLPNDPDNYYRQHGPGAAGPAGRRWARPRSSSPTSTPSCCARAWRRQADQGTSWPAQGRQSPFTETPDQMVRRVCRELRQQAEHHRAQRRSPPLLPAQAAKRSRRRPAALTNSPATSARKPKSATKRPGSGSPAWRRSRRRSASGRSTTSPPRPFSCGAPATPRAPSSPGWSPTSR